MNERERESAYMCVYVCVCARSYIIESVFVCV